MNAALSDDTFISRFERHELDAFSHADHVRLARVLLERGSLPDVLTRLCRGLADFAAAKGEPTKYHETITWAFVLLINERMQRGRAGGDWREFLRLNPDLADGIEPLQSLYRDATLHSELARATFLLPDRAAPDAGPVPETADA